MGKSPKDQGRHANAGVSFDTVRKIAKALAGAIEGTSYGTPAFHVGKTLFVRQHQDGDLLVVRIKPEERALRLKASPLTYTLTDHYVNYPWILVRMAKIGRQELQELLTEAWRLCTEDDLPRRPLDSPAQRSAPATMTQRRDRRKERGEH